MNICGSRLLNWTTAAQPVPVIRLSRNYPTLLFICALAEQARQRCHTTRTWLHMSIGLAKPGLLSGVGAARRGGSDGACACLIERRHCHVAERIWASAPQRSSGTRPPVLPSPAPLNLPNLHSVTALSTTQQHERRRLEPHHLSRRHAGYVRLVAGSRPRS